MLVGTNGIRIPHLDWLFRHGRPHTVGDNPVCGEVSAADDVSRTSGGYRDIFVREEAFSVAVRHEFRAAFAVGIGVLSIQAIRLPIAPGPFVVLVNFVRGDIQEGFDALTISHAFQQIDGSHDVRAVSCHRVPVTFPDDGLRCQVDDDFRLAGVEGFLKQGKIADVSEDGVNALFYAGKRIQVRLCQGRQCVSGHVRSPSAKPEGKPGALEAGVPGDKDSFPTVEVFLRSHSFAHTFHGALPLDHSFSSSSFSRWVSMHCQKPLCW